MTLGGNSLKDNNSNCYRAARQTKHFDTAEVRRQQR